MTQDHIYPEEFQVNAIERNCRLKCERCGMAGNMNFIDLFLLLGEDFRLLRLCDKCHGEIKAMVNDWWFK